MLPKGLSRSPVSPDDFPMADLVFVDAPCSGSGTWRRHPEAAWRLTDRQAIERLAALQRRILAGGLFHAGEASAAASPTQPVRCCPPENEAVAADFAGRRNPNFKPIVPIAEAAASPRPDRRRPRAPRRRWPAPPHMLQMTPAPHGHGRLLHRSFRENYREQILGTQRRLMSVC